MWILLGFDVAPVDRDSSCRGMNFHPLILQDYFISHHFPNFQPDIQVLPNPSQKANLTSNSQIPPCFLERQPCQRLSHSCVPLINNLAGAVFFRQNGKDDCNRSGNKSYKCSKVLVFRTCSVCIILGYPKSKFRGVNPGALMFFVLPRVIFFSEFDSKV